MRLTNTAEDRATSVILNSPGMRTFILCACLLFISAASNKAPSATASVIVKRLGSCDYFLLYNKSGYVVAEHYTGEEFDEGKMVYGNINTYGYVDIYNEDLDETEHIYIEDWGLNKSDAIEKLLDFCK